MADLSRLAMLLSPPAASLLGVQQDSSMQGLIPMLLSKLGSNQNPQGQQPSSPQSILPPFGGGLFGLKL
jgi:hypothetical protein